MVVLSDLDLLAEGISVLVLGTEDINLVVVERFVLVEMVVHMVALEEDLMKGEVEIHMEVAVGVDLAVVNIRGVLMEVMEVPMVEVVEEAICINII